MDPKLQDSVSHKDSNDDSSLSISKSPVDGVNRSSVDVEDDEEDDGRNSEIGEDSILQIDSSMDVYEDDDREEDAGIADNGHSMENLVDIDNGENDLKDKSSNVDSSTKSNPNNIGKKRSADSPIVSIESGEDSNSANPPDIDKHADKLLPPDVYIDVDEQPEPALVIDESSNDKESSISTAMDQEERLDDSQETQASTGADSIASQPQSTPNTKRSSKQRHRCGDGEIEPALLEKYGFPFKHGWKREIVQRNVVSSGKIGQCDVYYHAPTGKKLRSRVELESWLSTNKKGRVKIEHFTFARRTISEPPYENVRIAGKARRPYNVVEPTPSPKPNDSVKTVIRNLEKPLKSLNKSLIESSPIPKPNDSVKTDVRKVGRPPKTVSLNKSLIESSPILKPNDSVKTDVRKVGRPRKTLSKSLIETTPSQRPHYSMKAVVVRQRGRPPKKRFRKNLNETTPSSNANYAVKIVKTVGRPPKRSKSLIERTKPNILRSPTKDKVSGFKSVLSSSPLTRAKRQSVSSTYPALSAAINKESPLPDYSYKGSKTNESAFKSIEFSALNERENNNSPAPSSIASEKRDSPSTVSRTGPKIKYVPPKVSKTVKTLLKSKLQQGLKRPRRNSSNDEWLPSDENSDGEERGESSVRNVEVIKYGMSSGEGATSGQGNNEEDDLVHVLGTPSKLISSIVNPEPPPPPVPPIPFNLNMVASSSTQPMTIQVLNNSATNTQESDQLRARPVHYQLVNQSQVTNSRDRSVILVPALPSMPSINLSAIQARPGMPILLPKPPQPVATQVNPVLPANLPPPPPLASRPNFTRPGFGSVSQVSILPPPLQGLTGAPLVGTHLTSLIRPGPSHTSTNTVKIIDHTQPPPQLQPPPPRLQHCESVPPMPTHFKITNPSSDKQSTSSSLSTSEIQARLSTAPKTTHSNSDDLVDQIYNDLPSFLSMNMSSSQRSKQSSPQIRLLSYPASSSIPSGMNYYVGNKDKTNVHMEASEGNTKSSFFDIAKPPNTSQQECSDDADSNDSENEDSMLPISFGQPVKEKSKPTDANSTDADSNDSENDDSMLPISFGLPVKEKSKPTDANLMDSADESADSDSPALVISDESNDGKSAQTAVLVDGGSTDDSSSTLQRTKAFLAFKLVQDNFPAMLNIFGHLSMYDLLRAGRVCKLWYRISRMNSLWEKVVVKSAFLDHMQNAVKFFMKVGVTSLTIQKLPGNGQGVAMDNLISALKRMTQLKELRLNKVSQQIITRIMENMPHVENVGAESIEEAEPLTNRSQFSWSTFPKELAMAKAVDAILETGMAVKDAASMCSVSEAELSHLMTNDQSNMKKQEEDTVLLCCMRLSRMGFPITMPFIEKRMEEEVAKRPESCRPTPHVLKLACYHLLDKNQHLFEKRLPYKPSSSLTIKLSAYSLFIHKLYRDLRVNAAINVLAFVMKTFSVLNPAGNRFCHCTALSLLSAENIPIPTMLIFPNVVHYPESVSKLILVGSKDGRPTPNIITHYLRAVFSEIKTRPLIIFFEGHENVISDQLVSECINSSVFLHCVPQDICNQVFPGNHGGVLNSISRIFIERQLRVTEKVFIDLVMKEIELDSRNQSQVQAFAKSGIYPVKTKAVTETEPIVIVDKHSKENEQTERISNKINNNHQKDSQKNNSSAHIEDTNSSSSSDIPSQLNSGKEITTGHVKTFLKNRIRGRSIFTSVRQNAPQENLNDKDFPMDGTGDLKNQKLSEKRRIEVSADDDIVDPTWETPSKKLKESEQKKNTPMESVEEAIDSVIAQSEKEYNAKKDSGKRRPQKIFASVESLVETIDGVIAESRKYYEAWKLESENKKKEDVSSKAKQSGNEQTPDRPSLKIKLSLAKQKENIKTGRKREEFELSEEEDEEEWESGGEGDADEKVVEEVEDEEEEEEDEDEEEEDEDEEDESSSKEVESEEGEDEENDDDERKDSDKKQEGVRDNDENKENENEIASDVSEEEVNEICSGEENDSNEELDTSHAIEADSETESPVKKVKKKKKKKHRHHRSPREAKDNSMEDSSGRKSHKHKKKKKKRKKKKSKSEKSSEEKTSEEVAVTDTSSPCDESISETKAENKVDEVERKLEFIRLVSVLDHDYQTKFDSDSGTEAATEDSVHEVKMDFGDEVNSNGDISKIDNTEATKVVDGGVEDKPEASETKGDEVEDKKDETSDSDGSSSDSSENDGSSTSSTSSSSSSGSSSDSTNSGSEGEEESSSKVSDKAAKKKKNVEQSDSAESASSSGDNENSTSSEADSDDDDEEGASDESEEEEEEEEEEDDAKCQLCMLSNPPHTKDEVIDWVDCDGNCGRWFHVICITRSQAKANTKHYVCPSCRCGRW